MADVEIPFDESSVIAPYHNTLARKIAQIAASVVGPVIKDKTNEHYGYTYASDAAIISSVRVMMNGLDVAIIPSVIPDSIKVTPIGEKGMLLTTLVMQFKVIDAESGQFELANYPGAGSDYGDKGIYKAVTGATKYFYQKLFNIPTGDDPEAEHVNEPASAHAGTGPYSQHSEPPHPADDIDEAMPTTRPAARPAAKVAPKTKTAAAPANGTAVTVTKIDTKTGESPRGPWRLYIVHFSSKIKAANGKLVDSANTFDEGIATMAVDMSETGEACVPDVHPGNRPGSYELKALHPAQ